MAFEALRSDWYVTNTKLPRIVRQVLHGDRDIEFVGFPRQWIPTFQWFGLRWRDSIPPHTHIPFFSQLGEAEILEVTRRAAAEGMLRNLMEATSIHDAVLSDFLYIVDNTIGQLPALVEREESELRPVYRGRKLVLLNGWQSYGRAMIHELERAVDRVSATRLIAVALPCALRRPYGRSRTHKRIHGILEKAGYVRSALHQIVITAMGVLPEEVWDFPVVQAYTCGVPDIYRVLRLARRYFSRNRYDLVLDCLQFEPYSDVLSILSREGIVPKVERIRVPCRRPFHVRP